MEVIGPSLTQPGQCWSKEQELWMLREWGNCQSGLRKMRKMSPGSDRSVAPHPQGELPTLCSLGHKVIFGSCARELFWGLP